MSPEAPVVPIQVKVHQSLIAPRWWLATAPDQEHMLLGRGAAEAWARDFLQEQPGGGWVIAVDRRGQETSNLFVASQLSPARAALLQRMTPDGQLIGPATTMHTTSVVEVATVDLSVYWATQEPDSSPSTEIDGYRFRRHGSFLGVEAFDALHGRWLRWWINMTDEPSVVLSIGDDMTSAHTLGTSAPNTAGARVLEQFAPEVVALSRHGVGLINGGVVCVHKLSTPQGHEQTFLICPLTSLPSVPVGAAWIDWTGFAVEAAQRVTNACGDLDVGLRDLNVGELASVQNSPRMNWDENLTRAGAAAKNIRSVLELFETLNDLFSN